MKFGTVTNDVTIFDSSKNNLSFDFISLRYIVFDFNENIIRVHFKTTNASFSDERE